MKRGEEGEEDEIFDDGGGRGKIFMSPSQSHLNWPLFH